MVALCSMHTRALTFENILFCTCIMPRRSVCLSSVSCDTSPSTSSGATVNRLLQILKSQCPRIFTI